MRKALIETATGLVANVIVIEEGANWQLPEGCHLIDGAGAGPGDTWDGKQFVSKPPESAELPETLESLKA